MRSKRSGHKIDRRLAVSGVLPNSSGSIPLRPTFRGTLDGRYRDVLKLRLQRLADCACGQPRSRLPVDASQLLPHCTQNLTHLRAFDAAKQFRHCLARLAGVDGPYAVVESTCRFRPIAATGLITGGGSLVSRPVSQEVRSPFPERRIAVTDALRTRCTGPFTFRPSDGHRAANGKHSP